MIPVFFAFFAIFALKLRAAEQLQQKVLAMKFSDSLWEQIAPIYQRIVSHPFNVELAQGTLERDRFIYYMEQDAYYLVGFSKSLALIAGRANNARTIQQFLNFAQGALIDERELHANFLPPNMNGDNFEPSLACMGYTNYLIAMASTASIEEAIAAVLPCFWIYREVGNTIAAKAIENNPYARWIETYSSQEFSEGTDLAISILDEMASQCSVSSLPLMERAFEYCSLYEWHFWDDAYDRIGFRNAHMKNRPSELKGIVMPTGHCREAPHIVHGIVN